MEPVGGGYFINMATLSSYQKLPKVSASGLNMKLSIREKRPSLLGYIYLGFHFIFKLVIKTRYTVKGL